MSDFKHKTVNGIVWNVISQVVSITVTLTISVVLARLLAPSDFGVVGLVTVFSGFAAMFIDFGFGSAIIHKDNLTEADLSTVFWFNLAIGLFLTMLMAACSGLIALFYHKPILKPLALFLSLNFVIQSFSTLQSTLLTKKLDFKSLTIRRAVSSVLSGAVGITLAYNGFGVWSIAIQTVLSTTLAAILIWLSSPWRPQFVFSRARLRELSRYSTNVIAGASFNYWTRNIDNLLVGKFLGSAPLGIYSRAYALMLLPVANVSRVIVGVLFPSLSQIKHDVERVKSVFLRILRTIALITFPLMLCLIAVCDVFVLTLYGQKWAPMIVVLQLLSFTGMLQSIGMLTGSIYQSQGRPDIDFKVSLVVQPVIISAIVAGLFYGLRGVAAGYSMASALLFLPSFYFAGRLIRLSVPELLRNLAPIFAAALATAGLLYGLKLLLRPTHLPRGIALLALVAAGILTYWAIIHIASLRAYEDLKGLILDRIKNKRKQNEGAAML